MAHHHHEDEKAEVLKPYLFRQDNTVVISHEFNGALRISPQNYEVADGNGRQGKFARWKVHLQPNGHCKLQSTESGKYLRIWQRGKKIDVNGGGGPFTLFKIHFIKDELNKIKLESERFASHFVSIHNDKCVSISTNGNSSANNNCVLTFWRIESNQNSNNNNNGSHGHNKKANKPIKEVKCLLCKGKGYYGTFGWCDASSAHRKGPCYLCNGKTVVNENNSYQQCACCKGQGSLGKFGPCIKGNAHYLNDCLVCEGKGYLESESKDKKDVIIHGDINNCVCMICKGFGHYYAFGFCCEKDNRRKGTCFSCKGKGVIMDGKNSIDMKKKCGQCKGKGAMGRFGACDMYSAHFTEPCKACDAHGYMKK